jgi:DUF1009 family protein
MSRTAIIAGAGRLPAAVAAELHRPLICAFDGFTPEGIIPDLRFRIERLVPLFDALRAADVDTVTFAGAVQRPRLDPAMFDAATAQLVPRLIAAMGQGDDSTLREVIALFEEAGFDVAGTAEITPRLVPGPGVLAGLLTDQDQSDANRASAIVAALGSVDVGQGCVVQQGLCLGVEVLAGTDALLSGIAALGPLRPDPVLGRGVFFKAAKPGQDRRIDLPTLGTETVRAVAHAGLGGLAWQAGGVICLDLPQMQAAAVAYGLFLWAKA